MLTVTNVMNPLTGGKTTEEYAWSKGKTLAEYIGYGGECVVSRMGNTEIVRAGLS